MAQTASQAFEPMGRDQMQAGKKPRPVWQRTRSERDIGELAADRKPRTSPPFPERMYGKQASQQEFITASGISQHMSYGHSHQRKPFP